MRYTKLFAILIIALSIISLVMLGKKEIVVKDMTYYGENKNGVVYLTTNPEGFDIKFYPSQLITSNHESSDFYSFKFYDEKNKLVVSSATNVFLKSLVEPIQAKFLSKETRINNLNRVVIATKNAEYVISVNQVD